MGGFFGPELEEAHSTLTDVLLAKSKSHDCAQVQRRLGNVVQPVTRRKRETGL